MKQEDFKAKIGEELYKKVLEAVGDEEFVIGPKGTIIPKERLDEVITARDDFKTKLTAKETEFNALNEKAKGLPTLEKEKTDLAALLESTKTEHASELKKVKVDYAFRDYLKGKNAKDVDLVAKLFDPSKIDLDESGKLKGVDEQFESVSKGHEYLFGTENPAPAAAGGSTPPANPAALEKVLNDMMKL